jgi:hypothetical protein
LNGRYAKHPGIFAVKLGRTFVTYLVVGMPSDPCSQLFTSRIVVTELGSDIIEASIRDLLRELHKTALTADVVARAVLYAMSQPDGKDKFG